MGAKPSSAHAATGHDRCPVCGLSHGPHCQEVAHERSPPETRVELPLVDPRRPGAILDRRYRLDEELGRGAYGVVFSATDLRMGREVAIKLGPDPDEAWIAHQRFLREAQMMAEVGDPGTVVVFDYGTLPWTGHAFIVMERLRGETLRDRMLRGLPMPIEEARDIIGEVLMTLSTFHARGVIHRDLKPENIFLHESHPGERIVKVLDLGLARLEDESNLVTEPSEILGTPLYMAPELFRGTGIGHRTDIFAVATMLFELLTGRAPLERERNETLLSFFERSIRVPRTPLRRFRPDLPIQLDRALSRALDLDEEHRHPSARAFLRDLLEATEDDAQALTESSSSWRLSWPPPEAPGDEEE